MTSKPVLISGAGLGGLLLARSLRSSNTPFLLYERDQSIVARAQGYMIRISTDGFDALKQVLSESQFAKFHSGTTATGGRGVHSFDAITGNDSTFMDDTSPKGSQPTGPPKPTLGGDVMGVGRGWLRQCLFEGMEDVVHWGKRSMRYSTDEAGVSLNFADGTSSPTGSFLIAADEPQSTITKQLTDGQVKAYDTGARMIHGQSPARALRELGHGVFGVQDTSAGSESLKLGFITNIRPSVELDGAE